MVKILEDGTQKTYYTECQKCGSSMTYKYEDVDVEEKKIDFLNQYLVSKTVQCPKCGFKNCVVMQTEKEFKDAMEEYRMGRTGFPMFNSKDSKGKNQ